MLKQSATGPLPSLVVRLSGAVPLTLEGKVDIFQNRLRNTFPGAPDVPLSQFKLTVDGGKGGLLQAVDDLCRKKRATTADTRLVGWNGKVVDRQARAQAPGLLGLQGAAPAGRRVAAARRA